MKIIPIVAGTIYIIILLILFGYIHADIRTEMDKHGIIYIFYGGNK